MALDNPFISVRYGVLHLQLPSDHTLIER